MKPDKAEATLAITKFGSFTAIFTKLPPPIPSEYLVTLFAVVISAFIGSWLTPTVIDWRKTRNQGKKLEYYHNDIKNLHRDDILDKNDIESLDSIRDNITDDYTRGKITKDQFEKLAEEISIKYRGIFDNELGQLANFSENDIQNNLGKIKKIIDNSYAAGKINEKQYNLLKEKLLEYKRK